VQAGPADRIGNVRLASCLPPSSKTSSTLPHRYSNWPTIPQCYIDGEFVGGCDLLIEMYQNGELQEMVERAAAS
jgi:hypothetical protein